MSPRTLFLHQRARTTEPSAAPAFSSPTPTPAFSRPANRPARVDDGAARSEHRLVPVWPPARQQPRVGERGAETKGEPEALGGLFNGFQLHEKNRTGMPDRLKAGIEGLSGIAMDDVRVRYGSPEPARLQALAITRGSEIHLAPGQESHLAHEAWHVVQQKQGRVPATVRLRNVEINDDPVLEREADRFGGEAASWSPRKGAAEVVGPGPGTAAPGQAVQRKIIVDNSQFKGTSERPGWRAASVRRVIERYNEQHDTNYTEDDFNLTDLKQDIAHEVAFDTIQGWVLSYLSGPGPAGEGALRRNIYALMYGSPVDEMKAADGAVEDLVDRVKQRRQKSDIADSANDLLSILNSAQMNIRAANKYLNRYLHSHFDPMLEQTPSGQHLRALDHTKTLLRLGPDEVNDVARTPRATRVVTSEGAASLADMTPETKGLLSSHRYDQPVPRSANVRSALSQSNPYDLGSGPAPSGMKPKINLAPPAAAPPAMGPAAAAAPSFPASAPISLPPVFPPASHQPSFPSPAPQPVFALPSRQMLELRLLQIQALLSQPFSLTFPQWQALQAEAAQIMAVLPFLPY